MHHFNFSLMRLPLTKTFSMRNKVASDANIAE